MLSLYGTDEDMMARQAVSLVVSKCVRRSTDGTCYGELIAVVLRQREGELTELPATGCCEDLHIKGTSCGHSKCEFRTHIGSNP